MVPQPMWMRVTAVGLAAAPVVVGHAEPQAPGADARPELTMVAVSNLMAGNGEIHYRAPDSPSRGRP